MLRDRLRRAREIIRGAEHAAMGAVMAAAGSLLTLMEKLRQEDLASLLGPLLPSNWTPAEVLAAMGVAIVVLHMIVGNHTKRDGNGGGQ